MLNLDHPLTMSSMIAVCLCGPVLLAAACAPADDTAGADAQAAAEVAIFNGPPDESEPGSGYALFRTRGSVLSVHACAPTPGEQTVTCEPRSYTAVGPTIRVEGPPRPAYQVVWVLASQ